ncbi:glutathione S-transferase [Boletus edulis BED1]|uniref:glutathione transferase n=1 Tax=Boletus edulis BED1 TaxID=1328754 RepID=A0AAD4BVE8_BOLED|nr:glutathione S-transferase [Boletus edulis BED1]
MVLKIYGYNMSTCTRLVALICKEKEIPYELVTINLAKGEHKNPEYLKTQPFGQVPYIDDDGFILYESRAIARYLIKKYPNQGTTGLVPVDPKKEALFEQAASVEVSHFNSHAGPLMFEKLFKARTGGTTDQVKAAEHLKNLEAKLDVYEIILGKQKYLAGDEVTLADLQHLPFGSMLFLAKHGDVIEKRTNVARWWKDISNRPAWLAVKDGA